MKKIRKLISMFIAAAVVCSVICGIPASAGSKSAYDYALELAGVSYNKSYIDLLKKYSKETPDSYVAYSSSYSRAVLDKMFSIYHNDTLQYKIWLISEDKVYVGAIKGKYVKFIVCEGSEGAGIYIDPKKLKSTIIDLKTKKTESLDLTNSIVNKSIEQTKNELKNMPNYSEEFKNYDIDIPRFKIKLNGKTYYIEKYSDDDCMLFNSNGTCVAMYFNGAAYCGGITASVDDSEFSVSAPKKTSSGSDKTKKDPVLTRAENISGAKYNANYVKWAEKYSAKKQEDTVLYSESLTKKFITKLNNALNSKNPEIKANIITKDLLFSFVYKGKKYKAVTYEKDGISTAMFNVPTKIAALQLNDKYIVSSGVSESEYKKGYTQLLNSNRTGDRNDSSAAEHTINDSAEGKVFKFKSGDKSYVYEEFITKKGNKAGYLFDSSGNPLARVTNDGAECYSVKFSVKDSEFNIPSGYKTITEDEYWTVFH